MHHVLRRDGLSLNLRTGAALTIPSALALIVKFFPEPREQALALGMFGGMGGIGNGQFLR